MNTSENNAKNNSKPFWKKLPAYEDFIETEPTPFNLLFKDKYYEVVQLHDITPLNDINDIIGFVGGFSWINNKLTPSDGDSYYPETLVYGYKETDEALHVLVKDW